MNYEKLSPKSHKLFTVAYSLIANCQKVTFSVPSRCKVEKKSSAGHIQIGINLVFSASRDVLAPTVANQTISRHNAEHKHCVENRLSGNIGPGTIFCLLLGVSSDYAKPITGQVTEVTCPVIGRAQPELTPSKRQKMGPGWHRPHI